MDDATVERGGPEVLPFPAAEYAPQAAQRKASTRSVTAIVPTYNRAAYIAEAVESILGQREPVAQLIVVDDGSTDDTAAVLAEYGERIEYIRKDNGGKSAAINVGLARARGEWIWIFDDDDVAMADATSVLLDAAEINPGAQVAFGGAVRVTTAPDGSLEPLQTIAPAALGGDGLFLDVLMGFSFCLQAMLIRRQSLAAVGGLDERFLRGQDYELIVRLLRHVPATGIPRPVFYWRQHAGERGPARLRHAASDRDRLWGQFEALMSREIRAKVSLGEFLVPRVGGESLPATQRADALFNRGAVMATRGLLDEFMSDLSASLALRTAGYRLSEEQRAMVFRVGSSERFVAAVASDCQAALAMLRSLPSTRAARQICACLARALFYEYRARKGDSEKGPLLMCVRGLMRKAGLPAVLKCYAAA